MPSQVKLVLIINALFILSTLYPIYDWHKKRHFKSILAKYSSLILIGVPPFVGAFLYWYYFIRPTTKFNYIERLRKRFAGVNLTNILSLRRMVEIGLGGFLACIFTAFIKLMLPNTFSFLEDSVAEYGATLLVGAFTLYIPLVIFIFQKSSVFPRFDRKFWISVCDVKFLVGIFTLSLPFFVYDGSVGIRLFLLAYVYVRCLVIYLKVSKLHEYIDCCADEMSDFYVQYFKKLVRAIKLNEKKKKIFVNLINSKPNLKCTPFFNKEDSDYFYLNAFKGGVVSSINVEELESYLDKCEIVRAAQSERVSGEVKTGDEQIIKIIFLCAEGDTVYGGEPMLAIKKDLLNDVLIDNLEIKRIVEISELPLDEDIESDLKHNVCQLIARKDYVAINEWKRVWVSVFKKIYDAEFEVSHRSFLSWSFLDRFWMLLRDVYIYALKSEDLYVYEEILYMPYILMRHFIKEEKIDYFIRASNNFVPELEEYYINLQKSKSDKKDIVKFLEDRRWRWYHEIIEYYVDKKNDMMFKYCYEQVFIVYGMIFKRIYLENFKEDIKFWIDRTNELIGDEYDWGHDWGKLNEMENYKLQFYVGLFAVHWLKYYALNKTKSEFKVKEDYLKEVLGQLYSQLKCVSVEKLLSVYMALDTKKGDFWQWSSWEHLDVEPRTAIAVKNEFYIENVLRFLILSKSREDPNISVEYVEGLCNKDGKFNRDLNYRISHLFAINENSRRLIDSLAALFLVSINESIVEEFRAISIRLDELEYENYMQSLCSASLSLEKKLDFTNRLNKKFAELYGFGQLFQVILNNDVAKDVGYWRFEHKEYFVENVGRNIMHRMPEQYASGVISAISEKFMEELNERVSNNTAVDKLSNFNFGNEKWIVLVPVGFRIWDHSEFTTNSLAAAKVPTMIGYYKEHNDCYQLSFEKLLGGQKTKFAFAIKIKDLPKLEIYYPEWLGQAIDGIELKHDELFCDIQEFDQGTIDKYIAEQPNWLVAKGDEVKQKDYLQSSVELRIGYAFKYTWLDEVNVHKFEI